MWSSKCDIAEPSGQASCKLATLVPDAAEAVALKPMVLHLHHRLSKEWLSSAVSDEMPCGSMVRPTCSCWAHTHPPAPVCSALHVQAWAPPVTDLQQAARAVPLILGPLPGVEEVKWPV